MTSSQRTALRTSNASFFSAEKPRIPQLQCHVGVQHPCDKLRGLRTRQLRARPLAPLSDDIRRRRRRPADRHGVRDRRLLHMPHVSLCVQSVRGFQEDCITHVDFRRFRRLAATRLLKCCGRKQKVIFMSAPIQRGKPNSL